MHVLFLLQKISRREKVHMADLRSIADAVKNGRAKVVKQLVPEALAEGIPVSEILNNGLLVGMTELGELFKKNEVYVPEVLVAARAMKVGTDLLKPYMMSADIQSRGVVAIGTAKGDLHDIGKNLVRMMMEGSGFTVLDLGVDVAPEKFVEAVQTNGAQIVAISALLTTTMPAMRECIEALEKAGLRDKVKVMVGGAPVTQSFADEIGADAYTPDAASAAERAVELVS